MAKHPLKFYVAKYGIALGTIQNCVRKQWPLWSIDNMRKGSRIES